MVMWEDSQRVILQVTGHYLNPEVFSETRLPFAYCPDSHYPLSTVRCPLSVAHIAAKI